MASTVTQVLSTPPKSMTALQRAMMVHHFDAEFVSENTSVNIVKEPVEGVEGAYILKGVLTEEECQKFRDITEDIGFTEAPLSTGLNSAVMRSDIRDNKRVMATISNRSLAALQRRIADFIDKEIVAEGYTWHAMEGAGGLNERLRFYKYEVGQEFKPHYDGCFPRSEEECSFFTFIIYLNGELEGGQTAFFIDKDEYLVNPELGQALVFWHRTRRSPYHAGLPHMSQGKSKYVLRSDLMYRRGEKAANPTKKY